MKTLLLLLSSTLMLAACYEPTTTDKERVAQDALLQAGNERVGMPSIVNFQEKRVMKDILELRDTTIATITYVSDMQGHLHKRCDSIGFGLPYSTQYTNPQMATYSSSRGNVVLPQADPNGLYSPAAAEGTWVLCNVPGTDKNMPVYIEDRVTVSPFPLDEK